MLLMVFTINHTKFGIPLEEVEFIAENVGPIETTTSSGHILGSAILRDVVTPIYSLESRFGFLGESIGEKVIVVDVDGKKLGFNVKNINGIKYTEEFIFAEIPPIIEKENLCIKHAICCQQEIILVLDIKKIMDEINIIN